MIGNKFFRLLFGSNEEPEESEGIKRLEARAEKNHKTNAEQSARLARRMREMNQLHANTLGGTRQPAGD